MPLPLLPYQIEGANVLAEHERFGLHDEMGVGKTATTIGAIDKLQAQRGIVICPAMLRENWVGEFRKFSVFQRRICKGQNIHDFMAWLRGRYHILITSYEQATKWAEQIYENGEVIDFVAIDEAHYLKNSKAARTKAVQGLTLNGRGALIDWASHVWHITGTPMANDPLDIYTFLRLCNALQLSEESFVRRYFHIVPGRYGTRQMPRDEMVPELQALIANNSIRRTKASIGMQLPPIFLTSILVDGDTDIVKQMLAEHPGLEPAIRMSLEQGSLSFLDAQHIGTLRRLVGEAKAVPYTHMLIEELQTVSEKRVVFGIHKSSLTTVRDLLWKHGFKAVLVNGDTPEKQRVEAVRAFQEDEDCRVFIGNIRAAGVGLTLTASCEVDLMESDWAPAGNAQAVMRVHRIGQTKKVRARFVTLARSIDEMVNKIVAAKTAAIAQIEGEAMHASPLDVLQHYV